MKRIKYLFQYIGIVILFFIFKIIGIKLSSYLSGFIFLILGPIFRSSKLANENLKKALPQSSDNERRKILNRMWMNYGRILSEYMFIKNFRISDNYLNKIIVENQHILEKIKKSQEPVIFVSGHFNNFELMAMQIEKSGVDLAAIYRPLNNIFLNPIMENIRKKFICKIQIKKGISGTKQILKKFKTNTSIALMIDQRVSEGIKSKFFNQNALTTTIPAQFVKKFNTKIVPIYIERLKNNDFKLTIHDPIKFNEDESIENITLHLNKIIEKMILKNPDQWIWTHNRWK
tara:strand:- start:4952 stop:5815 length:864 start_codon:yes stop_codon:yes gene_type:complete